MMRSAKKDPLKWVKVVVLGNGAVGKSGSLEFFCCLVYHCGRYGGLNVVFLLSPIALTVRYLTNRFIHDYDPTFGELLRAMVRIKHRAFQSRCFQVTIITAFF